MRFRYTTVLLPCMLLPLVLSGCIPSKQTGTTPTDAAPTTIDLQVIEKKTQRIQELEKENAQLTNKLYEQKQLSQELQQALLIRHKENDNCLQTNEKLVAELVQNKAKLANRGSKLEAVTLIAEATAVISAVAKQPLDARQRTLHRRASQYLAESQKEVEKENFEGASYLCRKAMEQVRNIQITAEGTNLFESEEEVYFSTPLQMVLFKNGNLRTGPSTTTEVLTVLPAGSKVSAVGFKQEWVKVNSTTKAEDTGWIHFSLLY